MNTLPQPTNHTLALALAIDAGLWDIDTTWTPQDNTGQSHIVMLWPTWDAPTITATWRYDHEGRLAGFAADYAYGDDNHTTEIAGEQQLIDLIRQAATQAAAA
jgi:hypothetical protein